MASLSSQDFSAFPKMAAEAYSRHGRWLPDIAALILVMFIGTQLADLVWALMPQPASMSWKPAPVTVTTHHAEPLDISAITSAQLFGHATTTNTTAAAVAAPDTQLALTLLGIFADGRDPKFSRALIGAAGGDEKPYAIGDEITRGVTLQTIFPDRVVLSRNGQLETLRLEKDQASASSGAPATAVADVGPAGDSSAASSIQALDQIRSQLLSDPSKAQDFIRIQPVNTDGGLHGYRIYPGKDHSLFNNAGLKPGDVVTSVNGVSLDDPAKSLQLLSDLSKAQQLSLVIDRGGQSQTVSLSLSP